ncbi:MAG TPA: cytochrome c maturation protein CcmE [Thermoleophilia bacterium]|nr:cytochrome c maturation protein CcmE [Thermoleophilia bacterium]
MGSKKLKFLIGGLVVVGAIASLAFFAIRENMVYYYTVTEALANGEAVNVRVAGDLLNGTLEKGGIGDPIRFEIYDKAVPESTLYVEFTGVVPDSFKDDPATPIEVVVEGDLLKDGTFAADFMMAKCPTKYERTGADATGETSTSNN